MNQSSSLPDDIRQATEALLNGTLDEAGVSKLEAALLDNPSLQQRFLDYCQLHTDLGLSIASDRAVAISLDKIHTGPIHRVVQFFTQPTPLSMTVATAAIGLLLTAMAFMVPPFYRAITGIPEGGVVQLDSQRIVAELTAVHKPEWAVGQLSPNRGAYLQAGRRMDLEEGLVEVTFRSGAVVTIEGPSVWIVASEGVLQLESGQAAATVPAPAVGFKVHTPTAEIVDLSTSFGVKAMQDATEVHVFQGAVAATFLAADGTANSTMKVQAGESFAWDALAQQIKRKPEEQQSFVRRVPRRKLLPVFSTGKGMAVGERDPHWTITKAPGDSSLPAQNAVVTSLVNALPNEVDRSQWISNGHPPPITVGAETFTFRTSFDLEGLDSDAVTLRIRFAVDNLVRAIRLNGASISVPAHEYGTATFQNFLQIDVNDGFGPGKNVLEFDIFNADDGSHMGLRVELSGIAVEKH